MSSWLITAAASVGVLMVGVAVVFLVSMLLARAAAAVAIGDGGP